MSERMDRQIDQWLDGELDAEGVRELNVWIQSDPQHARRFAERSHLHSRLFDWAETQASPRFGMKTRTTWRRAATWGLAAAAAVVVGVFLFPRLQPPGDPVAVLKHHPGAVLDYRGRTLDLDDEMLRTGEYELQQGLAAIAFDNGVEMLVEAPARFRLQSSLRVEFDEGRVSAHVPPEGVGFTIQTPSAEVVDFGTDFAVEVGADQSSEVHVSEGEVEVQPIGGAGEPVRLNAKDATRIEFETDVPLGIPVDMNRFLWTLEEPTPRYAKLVRAQQPSLYFRMRVPDDGTSLKDTVGDSDGHLIDRGARRPPYASGKVGSSGRFLGPMDSSYLVVPRHPKATHSISGSAWIYAESRPRRGILLSHDEQGQFRLGLRRDTGRLQISVWDAEGREVMVRDREIMPLETWVHVGFIADGETLRLFRDGVEVGKSSCGPVRPVAEDQPLYIGGGLGDGRQATSFWHGRIDEVALFNHALTPEDIVLQVQSVPTNP